MKHITKICLKNLSYLCLCCGHLLRNGMRRHWRHLGHRRRPHQRLYRWYGCGCGGRAAGGAHELTVGAVRHDRRHGWQTGGLGRWLWGPVGRVNRVIRLGQYRPTGGVGHLRLSHGDRVLVGPHRPQRRRLHRH
jgi:hypothetical protein